MRHAHLLRATAVLALACAAAPAVAQEATAPEQARGPVDQDAAPEAAAPNTGDELSADIIVTAQRREQTLFEVPQAISVVGGETLERQQARSFLDYAQLVPGLSVTQTNPGESRVILRGVNTQSPGSTVAIYVDDVPFGASGSLSNAGLLAGDFDTFDVARVEVLKGPQGTLYGSNALGGVLKFVTATPSTERFELKGQAGIEDTRYGGISYIANAAVNIPLGDVLAFRASGFHRNNAGYVDAAGRTGRDINDNDSYGGRASLLFKPSDAFSVRLFALAQDIKVDSPSDFAAGPISLKPVDPITGAPTGERRLRYERLPEFTDVQYRLYSGTVDYRFGAATLTSVTSYAEQQVDTRADASTNPARGLTNALYAPTAPGTVGLAFQNDTTVEKFTQEVRLQSDDSDTFEWLIGGYYTDEKTNLFQRFLPFSLSTQELLPRTITFGGQTLEEFVTASIDSNYEEIAAFGSATVKFGERFDLTLGGRYSRNEQDSAQIVNQLGTGVPVFGESKENVFTWSVSPRFELSDRASVYGRVAKGYRPGGPNFIPAGAPADFPAEFDSDTLVSYEIGFRGETADRTFGIDASLFWLDWDDIQILTTVTTDAGPVGINTNGRRARIKGAEVTATLRPTAGLSMIANFAYNDAKLRDDTVPAFGGANLTGGLAGDRLPYSPEVTGNLSADYEWNLSDDATAFVGGNIRLVGDQGAGFSAPYRETFGRRLTVDGYQTVDLRAGVNFGGFSIQAFARNLTDEFGVVNATYATPPFAVPAAIGGRDLALVTASTIRPRTIGVTAGFAF